MPIKDKVYKEVRRDLIEFLKDRPRKISEIAKGINHNWNITNSVINEMFLEGEIYTMVQNNHRLFVVPMRR